MDKRLKWYKCVSICVCGLGLIAIYQDKPTLAILASGIYISATISYVGGTE